MVSNVQSFALAQFLRIIIIIIISRFLLSNSAMQEAE